MSTTDHDHVDHDDHDDFGGLRRDVPRLLDRRRALQWMGGLGLAGMVAACSSDTPGAQVPNTTDTSGTTAPAATAAPGSSTVAGSTPPASVAPATTAAAVATSPGPEIPDETAGPFPADGSNGPNVLAEDGVVRADLTRSIGSMSGTAEGVPTAIQLTIVDAATGAALPGAAVYLWHCTADGRYSIYEVSDQNYLRGVQVADEAGRLTFETIFPGCYPGRWPHCHFEVYRDLAGVAAGAEPLKVSQLALPQSDCEAVYADSRYGDSLASLGQLSLAGDVVFRDGWESQLATVVGASTGSITASLLVRV